MAIKKELTIDDKVKKEINRLKREYKDIPKNKMNVVQGLIVQAARLRISLDFLWEDIVENGDVELFSQSENQTPYERERPVARIFNTRDKNYQSIIKQLTDMMPKEPPKSNVDDDEFEEFVDGRPD